LGDLSARDFWATSAQSSGGSVGLESGNTGHNPRLSPQDRAQLAYLSTGSRVSTDFYRSVSKKGEYEPPVEDEAPAAAGPADNGGADAPALRLRVVDKENVKAAAPRQRKW